VRQQGYARQILQDKAGVMQIESMEVADVLSRTVKAAGQRQKLLFCWKHLYILDRI
jgi:hypothetical protein